MKKFIKTLGEVKIEYYINGKNPKLLILSGTHGDEYEIIECLRKEIYKRLEKLPDFLYIPVVSPSAVDQRKRQNKDGKDLNRSFFDNSNINEVKTNISILEGHHFDICLSFHEDPEYKDFYMYDFHGADLEKSSTLEKLRKEIRSLGVGLLNGIDDPSDPTLGNVFLNGYKYYPPNESGDTSSGFFAYWAFSKGIIKRYINPEIPGKLDPNTKEKIVDIIFRNIILAK